MIISRTPLRVSFAGGGTDLPAFYSLEGGAVVSTAIKKYIYVNVNPSFSHKIRASYSITEIVDKVDDLQHDLIRHGLQKTGITGGIEITSISDIPSSGTGLGSSSTYTVGLLNALYAYRHLHAGKRRLASEACEIEIDYCKKPIGKQDQFIAAYGGLQYIRFHQDGGVSIDPIVCEPQTKLGFEQRLLMLYTGITRSADTVLQEQSDNTTNDARRRSLLRRMMHQADELRTALEHNDLSVIGEILHGGWMMKKELAGGISTSQIDAWYKIARENGAQGGKVLGAGGGGFLLLFAEPEDHQRLITALPDLRPVPISFEPQGSQIIFVEEN